MCRSGVRCHSDGGCGVREVHMTLKEFIRADDLVKDSFTLARNIYDSGYRPDVLLVVWRGGTPVGIAIHEFLLYKGIKTYHAVIKAESYSGIESRKTPTVAHLASVLSAVPRGAKVLLIDDIFDTGCTLEAICERLAERSRSIRIATLYYKEGRNKTDLTPDFFLKKTSRWIVFPHELMDLSLEEIKAKDEYVYGLLK